MAALLLLGACTPLDGAPNAPDGSVASGEVVWVPPPRAVLERAFAGTAPKGRDTQSLNIAYARPTSQSSTYGDGASWRATDGNANGDWGGNSVTHTQADWGAWWQVDLGFVAPVNRVVIFNRTDCCTERLANFHVDLLGADGSTVVTSANVPGTVGARADIGFDGYAGRYVRIQLNQANFLSLAEVQVYPLNNLALARAPEQSSTYGDGAAWKAVDGNRSGNWGHGSVTHTQADAGAWWRVGLGRERQVGAIKIWNRTDCCTERLSNYDVLVQRPNGTTANWYSVSGPLGESRVYPFLSTYGDRVLVRLRGTDFLSLAEVEVFPAIAMVARAWGPNANILGSHWTAPASQATYDSYQTLRFDAEASLGYFEDGNVEWQFHSPSGSVETQMGMVVNRSFTTGGEWTAYATVRESSTVASGGTAAIRFTIAHRPLTNLSSLAAYGWSVSGTTSGVDLRWVSNGNPGVTYEIATNSNWGCVWNPTTDRTTGAPYAGYVTFRVPGSGTINSNGEYRLGRDICSGSDYRFKVRATRTDYRHQNGQLYTDVQATPWIEGVYSLDSCSWASPCPQL